MVERVNGSIRLGEYMKKYIWEPLGMESTGFRRTENEKIRQTLVEMTSRTPTGDLVVMKPVLPESPGIDSGGGGIYSSARDFTTLLQALLRNDGTLLSPRMVELMFTPQLHDSGPLVHALAAPQIGSMFRGGVETQDWNHGLGGLLSTKDVDGLCRRGTLSWNGMPNIFWVS